MYHNPKKPIKRTAIKPKLNCLPLKAKTRKKKAPTRSQLVKKLDDVFSKYIRQRDAVDGYATCVTCGTTRPWKEMQNGHYMSRGHLPTRWDETNCHVQDAACNVFKKGNYTEYAIYMVNRYGVDKLEQLKAKAKSGEKIPTTVIKDMIEDYSARLLTY
jgi:hypothetical protein